MPTLHEILEEVEELSFDDKFFLEEEIHRRNLEIKRNLVANEISASKDEYSEGKYKSFDNAEDFLADLNSDNS